MIGTLIPRSFASEKDVWDQNPSNISLVLAKRLEMYSARCAEMAWIASPRATGNQHALSSSVLRMAMTPSLPKTGVVLRMLQLDNWKANNFASSDASLWLA